MWALTALGLMQRPAMRSLSQRLEAVVDGSDMQPSSARQFLTVGSSVNLVNLEPHRSQITIGVVWVNDLGQAGSSGLSVAQEIWLL